MATLDLWYRKLAELDVCSGRLLQARLRLFRLPLITFERNCDELTNALRSLQPAAEQDGETVFEFGDWAVPQVELITYFPHISAALSLNYTRTDRRSRRFVSSRMEAGAEPGPNPAAPHSCLG
jgi:hypothetical protein